MKVVPVFTKKFTRRGRTQAPQATEYKVAVEPGKFIQIFRGDETPNPANTSLYNIGDQASYGSYNLVYFGTIKKITENTVTVGGKRLSMNEFCWRNYNLDMDETRRQNAEMSMYI